MVPKKHEEAGLNQHDLRRLLVSCQYTVVAVARSAHTEDLGFLQPFYPDRSDRFEIRDFPPTVAERFIQEAARRTGLSAENMGEFLAGDLLIPMSEGVIGHEQVIEDLHEITSGKKVGRTAPDEITVFKNLGCALEDLVTATLAFNNAESRVKA